jgi:hypothetical protein
MKKEIIIVIICSGLIFFTPFTSIAKENTLTNDLIKHTNNLSNLVNKMRFQIDEILEKYGHLPMVSLLCNQILNGFGPFLTGLVCISYNMLFLISFSLFFFFIQIDIQEIAGFAYILCVISIYTLHGNKCIYPVGLVEYFLDYVFGEKTLPEIDLLSNQIDKCPCLDE